MLPEDSYFHNLSDDQVWQRYCGFMELSLGEFMEIQEELLMDAVDRVGISTLGKKIFGNQSPRDLDEFQSNVPLTTYEDYEPYLSERDEAVLAEKPVEWCHSSGRGGKYKWIPHTEKYCEKTNRNLIASFIMASAKKRGDIRFRPGSRVLIVLPPPPYASGTMYNRFLKQISCRQIPPLDLVKDLEFADRLRKGFEIALREGVDILGAISSVLVRMGKEFASQARKKKFSLSMLHPKVVARMLKAVARSKMERRTLLPKDLWSPKGIVAGAMDTFIYKDDITHYWGITPFDFYVCTELIFTAMQGWNKKAMTFIADSAFYEFLPLEPSIESSGSPQKLLTLDKLEEGKLYEVIITQFDGMPLIRYRIGDVIKVLSLRDEETGIELPQFAIQRKVGETIDLAGLATLDEKTIWQAISNAGLDYTDWTACKEFQENNSYLNIYVELREQRDPREIEPLIHEQLQIIDEDYRDIERYLKQQPVKVTPLAPGTFMQFMDEKRRGGADLAHLKPKHVNPRQEDLQRLLIWSKMVAEEYPIKDR